MLTSCHVHKLTCTHTHTEVFSELRLALESLRKEEFTWDEDINFLQSFLCDLSVKAVADVNDGVAKSQSFEQPVGPSKESCMEVRGCVYNIYTSCKMFVFAM